MKDLVSQDQKDEVTQIKVQTEDERRDHYDRGRIEHFFLRRPCHLFGFDSDLLDKGPETIPPFHAVDSSTGRGLAGQEGLEPPTAGFGDRCSTN